MLRVRFTTDSPDPRPINWPIPHPYWITGDEDSGARATIVSYADSLDYIRENWPEAENIESEEVDGYIFTDRFPRPQWFTEVDLGVGNAKD